MSEYKKIKIETEELTKVLCNTCKKEIYKYASSKTAYIPSEVITANGWGKDELDFCSLECFLKWAEGEIAPFDVSFPFDGLRKLASEYARLKSRDSRLNDMEIKEEK